MRDVHHATVLFQGRVQGVGFRYTAMEVARGYDVTGFVQNLPDGRVLLEAEGEGKELDDFIAAVEDKMHHFIRKTEKSSSIRTAQFEGFTIR